MSQTTKASTAAARARFRAIATQSFKPRKSKPTTLSGAPSPAYAAITALENRPPPLSRLPAPDLAALPQLPSTFTGGLSDGSKAVLMAFTAVGLISIGVWLSRRPAAP